jgi:Domain of unknown function (DUF4188)
MIIKERMTAKMNDSFVVFMIGMRINKFWKIHKWWPVAMAMPKMIKELMANKKLGFISAESWFGRITIMLQYWESFEKLEAYARNKDAHHLPAWQEFNKRIKSNGDVGIWHETYIIPKGSYECIYNNMPRFGLGKAGELIPAKGNYHNAKDRVNAAMTS